MSGLNDEVLAINTPPAIIEHVKQVEVEEVQPGEVHSSEWHSADARSYLSGADTRKALATLDYKANPLAALPYFTNGLGLEQVYERWVVPSLSQPNKVAPVTVVPKEFRG